VEQPSAVSGWRDRPRNALGLWRAIFWKPTFLTLFTSARHLGYPNLPRHLALARRFGWRGLPVHVYRSNHRPREITCSRRLFRLDGFRAGVTPSSPTPQPMSYCGPGTRRDAPDRRPSSGDRLAQRRIISSPTVRRSLRNQLRCIVLFRGLIARACLRCMPTVQSPHFARDRRGKQSGTMSDNDFTDIADYTQGQLGQARKSLQLVTSAIRR